jgi:hypothetical protein
MFYGVFKGFVVIEHLEVKIVKFECENKAFQGSTIISFQHLK